MKKRRIILLIIAILAVMVFAYGCQNTSDSEENEEQKQPETDAKPVVTMVMEDGGEVKMELYPNIAPNTVNNFISLVESGFYDGLTFHRVIPDFMIQGGDPDGDGTGGPGYAIKGEFSSNGFENNLSHEEGVLSMARSQDPNSAGSQFFIMTAEASHLNGDYAAFGKVIDGMETVHHIASVERDPNDKPLEDQVIDTMTVELDGYQAQEPVKE